ncbi:MAG: aspartate kinase [Armatimonadota bacterium]|nr:aspartate kinase [Armatimonadota bacterium]MDR5697881.1 aspartate kinase [Armatimonadota bacterium]
MTGTENRHHEPMGIVVQKYGGTLLQTEEGRARVASQIEATRAAGHEVVVVASAIGRAGEPYATDTLLGLAKEIDPDVEPRTLDLLLSCGEIISTALLAHLLTRRHHPAVALTGAQAGILTSEQFGDARILTIRPGRVWRALGEGRIPVVAGFQGVTATGEITTLGRGGSDTTAVAMGAALGADLVEIFKDVDGVMTSDPQIVPDARPIPRISYDEVSQMAWLGARVLHPRAADIGREHGVRLIVRKLGSQRGTEIVRGADIDVPIHDGRVVIGLAHLPDVTQLRLRRRARDGLEEPLKALRVLAEAGISIDLINLLPELLAFTVREEDGDRAEQLLEDGGFDVERSGPCAKVSIIGAGIRGVPGVMMRVVRALQAAGIDILETADSHTTISCLVHRKHMEAALRALHDEFRLAAEVHSVQEVTI